MVSFSGDAKGEVLLISIDKGTGSLSRIIALESKGSQYLTATHFALKENPWLIVICQEKPFWVVSTYIIKSVVCVGNCHTAGLSVHVLPCVLSAAWRWICLTSNSSQLSVAFKSFLLDRGQEAFLSSRFVTLLQVTAPSSPCWLLSYFPSSWRWHLNQSLNNLPLSLQRDVRGRDLNINTAVVGSKCSKQTNEPQIDFHVSHAESSCCICRLQSERKSKSCF